MTQPLDFTLAAQDFDVYLLPEDSRNPESEAFRHAVAAFYAQQFQPLGGTTAVTFDDDVIHVVWMPEESSQRPFEYAVSLLKAGQLQQALPILYMLLRVDPDNVDVLYNAGIAESDLGHVEVATGLLESAVERDLQNANAWVALGMAHYRSGKSEEAILALERAVQIKPENAYAHRNLGGLLGNRNRYEESEIHLRAAARLMPNDQTVLYGLAHSLELTGVAEKVAEADRLYNQVVALDPNTDVAETAKGALRRIAHRTFRNRAGVDVRLDAVVYCLGALQKFATMNFKQIQDVTFEIGMLGQRGLDVNNPESKYRLRTMEGTFSGLHLISIMYTGFKQIAPDKDIGFDMDEEYALAKQMFYKDANSS